MANTGYRGWTNLERYNVRNGRATGQTKPNVEGDPDYVAPVYDDTSCPIPIVQTAWRGINLYCITSNGENTGEQGYANLEQYNTADGVSTGITKVNDSDDPDYIPNWSNTSNCPQFILTLTGDNLTWTSSAMPNIKHYQVYKQQDNGFFAEIGDAINRHRNIEGVTITPAYYCFKVRPENTTGTYGAFSNVVCFTRENQGGGIDTAVQLASGTASSTQACTNANNGNYSNYWTDSDNFFEATQLYTNSDKTTLAELMYYSDGMIFRYWNGTNFSGSSGFCQV